MRTMCSAVALVLGFTLAGCGGGGGGGPGGTVASQVAGKVTVRNGSAQALSGVFVECTENSDAAVTGVDGSFHLDVPSGEPITIHFNDPLAVEDGTETGGKDCDESDDPAKDSQDASGGQVEIEPLGEGEVCNIEIEIEDGQVVECRITHEHDGEESGEGRLAPAPGAGENAAAEVEVGRKNECFFLELEVGGLTGPLVLDVFVVDQQGTEAFLGSLEVNAEGHGHFEIGSCKVGGLPFGAQTLADLAGFGIVVRNREDGSLLFDGQMPGVGVEPDGKNEGGKDDGGQADDGKDEGGTGDDGTNEGGKGEGETK